MAQIPLNTRFIGISENVNLTERKSAVLNAETQPYTIADLVSTIGTGSQGPQGVEGPAGPPGPVGPAGLEWQGQWVSGTSYVEDDAVGYDGASWFCILATNGTDSPDVDPTHWALLASQGAIGPQGVQGPVGPQGPAGSTGSSTLKAVQVTITQAEILNVSGFTKELVSPVAGKVMVPLSIVSYRKNGGTAYSIANSVRLNTVVGSSSSSLSTSTIDTVFVNSTEQTQITIFSTTNTLLMSGNSLALASGFFSSPSVITGGTGDLIVCVSYIEIDTI